MKLCKTCKLENYPCANRKVYGIYGQTIGCEDGWKPKPKKKRKKK